MEQNDDIPVPGRGGRIAGLQGFLPGQSSTALHGSQERISARIVEQNVDFPVGGGIQDFRSGCCRTSTLQFRMVVVELLEVFKVSLDIALPLLWSRPLTFQLRAVVYGVFKVFSRNRVQQRLVKQIFVFQQRLSRKTLTVQFLLKVFKIYARTEFCVIFSLSSWCCG